VGLEVREKQRELAGITARTQAFTSIAVFENSTIRAIIYVPARLQGFPHALSHLRASLAACR
jgi:hypothetical protein